jgi:hypothetical protein
VDGAEWLRTELTSCGCAACGRPYRAPDIHVLAERDGLFFIDLGCASCGSKAVAIVTIELDESGAQAADLSDLDHVPPDADGRWVDGPGPPIGPDDVLAVHEFLRDFDGDFAALFARVRGRARGPDDG